MNFGNDDVPKTASKFIELGTTGLKRSGGYVSQEFLPQLQGYAGAKVYGEMAENDPILGGVLFAITMLLRQTPWSFVAKGKDKESLAAKDLAEEVLFSRLTASWPEILSEICTMFIYGYAPHEIVWARDEQGNIQPRKLALRSQETLLRWAFDEQTDKGALLGMWQMDPVAGQNAFIPATRLLNFRTSTVLNNPEGQSILRRCYVSWVRKKAIEEAEGRAALRAAGVVVLRVPSDIMLPSASDDEKAMFESFKTMLTNLATDRQGGIILPSDLNVSPTGGTASAPLYDFKYELADGKRQADMSPLVERIDKRMAGSVLADFMLLGQQATGSFALSSDKTSLFTLALGAWNQIIAGPINRQLLPRWWALNGWDQATMPFAKPGPIEAPDLGVLGAYITALANAGAPLFPDPELEKFARGQAGMPLEASPEALPIAGPGAAPPNIGEGVDQGPPSSAEENAP